MTQKRVRNMLSDILENMAEDVIRLTGCFGAWGEIELPECLRISIHRKRQSKIS